MSSPDLLGSEVSPSTPGGFVVSPRSSCELRIAYVFPRSDAIGGAVVHIRDMALRLQADGHRVAIWLGGSGPCFHALARLGLDVRSLRCLTRNPNPLMDALALRELRSQLKRFAPNVISTHCAKAGFIGRLVGKSLGIPTFFTPHCWSFAQNTPSRRLYLLLERLVAGLSERIFLVADREREEALAAGICDASLLTTIHNGMPDVDVSLRARPEEQPATMIMVARFERQKDHATLFRALEMIRELAWEINLVGGGPLEAHFKKLADEMGLASRIHFLGERSDVAELMADSQIFLLISNWEGFPRSILESFRSGLPTVVTDTGGCSEAVSEGVEGFLVKKQNASQLALALKLLLDDPALRAAQGELARLRYEREFRFEDMYMRYLGYYLCYEKRQ